MSDVFSRSLRRAPGLAIFAALFLASAFGQEGLSTLRGTITDSSGAVVPNVEVVAREVLTNFIARTVKTGEQGNFEMPGLKAGTYQVTAPRGVQQSGGLRHHSRAARCGAWTSRSKSARRPPR